MIEQLISFGSEVMELGSKAASIFGAVSTVAGWSAKARILEAMQKQHIALERIAEDIHLARSSGNIVLPRPQPVDFHHVNHLFVPAQKALKTDIVVSGFLRSPDALRDEFERNVWDCLHDIRPIGDGRGAGG